jgi:recombination protein U
MTTLQQQHCKLWERYIRMECRDLKRSGQALVRKNHEAPKIPGKAIPREPSKPDFSGIIQGGRHVCFEAKATLSETSISFHAIAEPQWDHLNRVHEAGGVAWVYVLDGNRNKWVLPWADILETRELRESFPFSVERFQKVEGETWLDTLRRLEVIQ